MYYERMSILPCRHRLVPERESYCWRETARAAEDGMALMFQARDGRGPVRCDRSLAAACPFREWSERAYKARMVSCPHCHRRHREGSNSQMLCEAWSSVKMELARMRRETPEGHRYYEEGTTRSPYDEHTTALIRRLVWQRLKGAVLRRDRYRCQDCGVGFNGRRRKVYDPRARGGRGGYRWESLEVHHIMPRALGGSDHPGNLKTLCPACHQVYTHELTAGLVEKRRERRSLMYELRDQDEDFVEDPWDAI